jgi:nitrile hydratase subunit beta
MNGPNDLGGQMGFGAIAPEPNEPVFHAEWEGRTLGLTNAFGGLRAWNIDANRHRRELLPPAQYLSKSYYDIWITAFAAKLVERGLATPEEVASGHARGPAKALARAALSPNEAVALIARGSPYLRPAPAPARFAAGDRVRTKVMNPVGHTRLPRYARGKVGIVEARRGAHVYPDSNAHGLGEDPQWLYTVRFTGVELWGEDADPKLSVSIDAFEPYLDHA